ncbi:hypothetical protein CLAFUW4_08505 [Fulvia fulva]|uniref:Xylanolytic transcriptional activator regulatory domain-containing protein n=1 Tax=Passalora fulva TaxID=5499 RepID=A0A9Q8LCC2_PASFU|nr:uncharacterized protein CLAFUR5_08607 [Fulvia fulva]KAK4629149.1 hypothetical protein CLAFUR4_08510 [Fulvia fulva]KAK4630647.1 hypothetical protein CLAFUR0_08505 [Fulvia fulva]UJO14870.1 hypothetical protein CLAFUR5_08607 [Fulvia fulva]WPV12245.1 hypothetical protein CLAFUW4_08505 [Fulvia fulva]WPV27461.1 hypothetical protein CLAFUW7_08505 [Fulvia fulva]
MRMWSLLRLRFTNQAADAAPAMTIGTGLSLQDYASLDNIGWNSYISSPDWPLMGIFAADDFLFDGSTLTGVTVPDSYSCSDLHASANDFAVATKPSVQDEVTPELVGQIAAHIGSLHLGPDGQLQYYGAATNSHVLGTAKSTARPVPRSQSLKNEVHHLLQQADPDTFVEEDLAHHFLGLSFSCYNSCHAIVDATLFWSARKRYRELDEPYGLYSEVLDNMMCAIGASHDARYHSRLSTFPRTLAEFFADRAKALLDFDLDEPCISTVQALVLLSSHEAGIQRLARSSMYSDESFCMAMRSAFDLGLHVPVQPYIA